MYAPTRPAGSSSVAYRLEPWPCSLTAAHDSLPQIVLLSPPWGKLRSSSDVSMGAAGARARCIVERAPPGDPGTGRVSEGRSAGEGFDGYGHGAVRRGARG